jgi:hypothetical protein
MLAQEHGCFFKMLNRFNWYLIGCKSGFYFCVKIHSFGDIDESLEN